MFGIWNPLWWLTTPEEEMAKRAQADQQEHAEAMLNPVPCFPLEAPPHNRAQALQKVLDEWIKANSLLFVLDGEELDDLYRRLKAFWADQQIEGDTEAQAIATDREKGVRTY